MTFRRPSWISRSFRLSKSFLTCTKGKSLFDSRLLTVLADPADCAASRVNSRAAQFVSVGPPDVYIKFVPVSSMPEILDIDSIMEEMIRTLEETIRTVGDAVGKNRRARLAGQRSSPLFLRRPRNLCINISMVSSKLRN